jgi:hypothetical protein
MFSDVPHGATTFSPRSALRRERDQRRIGFFVCDLQDGERAQRIINNVSWCWITSASTSSSASTMRRALSRKVEATDSPPWSFNFGADLILALYKALILEALEL